jgi:folate-binding protein YgfZ
MTPNPVTLAIPLSHRGVVTVTGADRATFLQGLVTQDMRQVSPDRAAYACLLTANGRFLHDFLVLAQGETLFLTPERARAGDLVARLRRYVLRSQVTVQDASAEWGVWSVCAPDGAADASTPVAGVTGTEAVPEVCQTRDGGLICRDPRHANLGNIALLPVNSPALAALPVGNFSIWDRRRIRLGVPDGSRDMIPERAILLENNIDQLHGIAWDKGCYMGQELTARTHYRGLVRKGLWPVRLVADGGAWPDFDVVLLTAGGGETGHLRSHCGDLGLALLRLEDVRAGDVLRGPTGEEMLVAEPEKFLLQL